MVAPQIEKLTCPSCQVELGDYPAVCPGCGLDLLTNEIRPPAVMATSLNRKDQSVFFYVSPLKLYVMSVVTFGLYELFWTYKNWFYVEDHTNKRLSPLFRTLFSIIWFYDLIREINKAGEAQGIKGTLSPWLLAFGYVVLGIFANIFAPLYLLWMAILIPVQKHINLMNRNSPTPINDKFTALNIAIIVIFAGYWAWVLFGYFAIFD
jgi:hypothetical protein